MSIDEIIERMLSEKFKNSNDMDKISEFIRSCKEKLTITIKGIPLEDVAAISKGEKEPNLEVTYGNNEIESLYDFKELKKVLVENIQSTIKEITLPSSILDDNIDFLQRLESLNKLTLSSYGFLTPEQLSFIKEKTNIKEIIFNGSYIQNDKYDDDLIVIHKDDGIIGCSNDVVFRSIPKKKENDNINIWKSNDIEVDANQVSLDDLERILNLIGEDLSTMKRTIEIKGKEQKYVFNIIDGMVNMDIEDPDMNVTNTLQEFFEKKGIQTNGVFVKITKGYMDKDLEGLDKLSKKAEVRIRYGYKNTSTYDEFKGLTESMKWYRQIIKDYPLSPVEKLAFAYDILKTFQYNETENRDDKTESREPHKIIRTGHIVCAGYTSMLQEIFEELDENIHIGSFSVTCYDEDDITWRGFHSRSIAVIDDKKYGIHGAYALDPTWDSFKEEGKEKIDSEYTALDLYKYFMIPFSEYSQTFKHDSNINFFQGDLSYLNSELSDENIDKAIASIDAQEEKQEGELPFERKEPILNSEIKDAIEGKSEQEVLELFKAKKIPDSTMMQIIRNVRLAEGYNKEQIEEEMTKVTRIYDKSHPEVDQLTGKIL